jgi:hypothetical protein
MLRISLGLVLSLFLATGASHAAEKSKPLFNGKDLKGWEGNPEVWTVEDGAIVGRTTADKPIKDNTFLIWKDGKTGDFRLTLEYKIEGGNSGVQYRSKVIDPAKWIVGGYQADIDSTPTYTGIMYDERGRGILAKRGERTRINADGKLETESIGNADELQKAVKKSDWNNYLIEAVGPRMRHTINGKLMSVTIDRNAKNAVKEGVLALQVHAGPPMTVRFRNIRLEEVDAKKEANRKKNRKGRPKTEAKSQ